MRRSDTKLIEHLAAGDNIVLASKLAGMSRRTVTRRLADPQFRQKVADARKRIIDGATGKMAVNMTAATYTLCKLLRSERDTIRLQAARAILELGVKLRDATELEERITRLEAALVAPPP